MSYSKLNIHYATDERYSRQGEKHKTLALTKKVQEYGDKYGYDKLHIGFNGDHIIITHEGTVLLSRDINSSNKYFVCIVSYEWQE